MLELPCLTLTRGANTMNLRDYYDKIDELPDEIWVEILFRMPIKDILHAVKINQKFAALARNDALWAKLFKKHFGVDIIGTNHFEKFILHRQVEDILIIALGPNRAGNVQLIMETMKRLEHFANYRAHVNDNNWLNYLLGKCSLVCSLFIPSEEEKLDAQVDGTELLLEAANLQNPLAMITLGTFSSASLSAEQRYAWLLDAEDNLCVEGLYQLFMYYSAAMPISGFHALPKFFAFLTQSAEAGDARGMLELARRLLLPADAPEYIPATKDEWKSFNLQHSMFYKLHQTQPSRPEIFNFLARLNKFADRGVGKAAQELAVHYGSDPVLGIGTNSITAKNYKALAKILGEEAKLARRSKARFFAQQAVLGGSKEAKTLLDSLDLEDESNAIRNDNYVLNKSN
jgi:hypothetical protein